MSTEANKNLVRRYYEEVLNGRNLGILDELAVSDYDEHSPLPGQPNDSKD
jgi:predicted SnoaL-like aldol condensation-catalyzing enzyme